MQAMSALSELEDCMYVLTHVTSVDRSMPYTQRPEREVAFGHNVAKWKHAALAFEP
jgi:hypothetical protein